MTTSPDLTRHFLSPRKESLPTLRLALIWREDLKRGMVKDKLMRVFYMPYATDCKRNAHGQNMNMEYLWWGIWGMQTHAKLQLAQGEQAHVEDRTKDMYIHMYIYIYI